MTEFTFTIDFFGQVAEAVGKLGDSITKIADGINHAIQTGVGVYDLIAVRRTRKKLKVLLSKLQDLRTQNRDLLAISRDFLRNRSQFQGNLDLQTQWKTIRAVFIETYVEVKEISRMLDKNASDVILEDFFFDLKQVIHTRGFYLEHLRDWPMPESDTERNAFSIMIRSYDKLANRLAELERALAEYIKLFPIVRGEL